MGARRVAAVIAALIVLMLSAGQAQASAPGAGAFVGWEYPPPSTETGEGVLCATFHPTEAWPENETNGVGAYPLTHIIKMDGVFHGQLGEGLARYESTNAEYNANPVGTYAADDDDCSGDPYTVPGTVDIEFEDFTCSGDGGYLRTATSVYTLTADVTCDNGGGATTVEFTGVQEVCPPLGCPLPPPTDENGDDLVDPFGPSAMMEGDYAQTDG